MPRCCATIVDPQNKTKVLVHCEVDHDDEAAGKRAAKEAAEAAYGKAHPGQQQPDVKSFTLPGLIAHTTVDLRG